jgi:WD40 repeat protein
MPAIFISHSNLDHEPSERIKAVLQRFGFERVFLDFDKDTGIGAGEQWEKRLYEELVRCHAAVLILTPHWLRSKWCFVELAQARALGKVVLPVRCAPLDGAIVTPEIQSVEIYDGGSDGMARLERRLRSIYEELARGFTFDPLRSPYPGIHSFEAADAGIYFGRDDEVRMLVERLEGRRIQGWSRFQIVVGASGSGKSSLLKAGVLPQLARRRDQWLTLPPLRVERDPFEALAKVLCHQGATGESWEQWRDHLRSSDAVDHIERFVKALRVGEARSATVLLPIDQFEEVFTVPAAADSAAFLNLLASILDPVRDLPLMILATGRSDVLGGILDTSALARFAETFFLEPMPLERMPRLVEGPAAVAGLNIETGLPQLMADHVESSDALPLLAYTLWLLFERGGGDKKLTLDEYGSLGDVERGLNPIQNSVRLVADEALRGLKPTAAELAELRDAFVPHLVRVRLDDGRRLRQPAMLAELPAESLRLVRALIGVRLLTARGAGPGSGGALVPEAVVEVTHEALFKAWPTLDGWLAEEQAFLVDVERMRNAHQVWLQAAAEQKSGALLYGLLLSRAKDWVAKYPHRFRSREMQPLAAYVAASVEAETAKAARARRMEQRLLRGALVAAAVLAVAAFIAFRLYVTADNERRTAIAREIFVLAQGQAGNNDECGLQLAVAAYDAAKGAAGIALLPFETLVRNALARSSVESTLPCTSKGYGEERFSWRPGHSQLVFADTDENVWTWSPGEQSPRRLRDGLMATSVEWLPSGDRLAVVTSKGIELLHADTWDIDTSFTIQADSRLDLTSIRFNPTGDRCLAWSGGRTLLFDFSAHTARRIRSDDVWRGYAWAPDGKRYAAAVRTDAISVEDLDGSELRELTTKEPIRGVAWSPDGRYIVAGLDGGGIWVWNAETGVREEALTGHTNQVVAVEFSADGQSLASASWDQSLIIWDTTSWRMRHRFTAHTAGISSVRWDGTGHRLATASVDDTVRVWSMKGNKAAETWLRTPRWIWSIGWNADGSLLAATWDGQTEVRDADGAVRTVSKAERQFTGGAWPASGSRYAIIDNAQVLVVDALTGDVVLRRVLSGDTGKIGVAFSPDGSRVVVSSTAGLECFSVPEGTSQWSSKAISPGLAFKPDSSILATAPLAEDYVALLDAATGAERGRLRGVSRNKATWALSWSPDGHQLAAGSDDKTLKVWRPDAGVDPTLVQRAHDRDVKGVAWNSDGTRLATAALDGSVAIWAVPGGEEVATFTGHSSGVRAVAWSKDDRTIATGGEDGVSRLFAVRMEDVLAAARAQRFVGLTATEYASCMSRISQAQPTN